LGHPGSDCRSPKQRWQAAGVFQFKVNPEGARKNSMKILMVHNFYQQPGGEDVVFAQEHQLLESKGHRVITYTRTNYEADRLSGLNRVRLLRTIIFANDSRDDVASILREEKPDLVHIHNTFMMVSPSIYQACAEAGVPTVQTLHNYRLLCPAHMLYRDGHVCEECIDHGLLRGVRHGCYRNSTAGTAAVAMMLKVHRARGTWNEKVNAFIALTEFAKQKFVDSGLPSEKVHVKPNFVAPDPGEREVAGDYALFVGRLSPEKGVSVLLEAWRRLKYPMQLKIVGDGPARLQLEAQAERDNLRQVEFLGRLGGDQVREVMKQARVVVVPSLWYEGFPMVLAESFACGVPVLVSRLGAMQEVVDDGHIGLHFTPGDAEDLARKVRWTSEHPFEMAAMGRSARQKFETKYGSEANYGSLMDIYAKAIDQTVH
jgi:glycosyltransferase involved in cell wall biosynthesis